MLKRGFDWVPRQTPSVHNTYKSRGPDVKSTHDQNSMIAAQLPGVSDPVIRPAAIETAVRFQCLRACFEGAGSTVKSGKMEEHTNMLNVNETGEQPKRRAVTAESMA